MALVAGRPRLEVRSFAPEILPEESSGETKILLHLQQDSDPPFLPSSYRKRSGNVGLRLANGVH
jgi:hypothetical protein